MRIRYLLLEILSGIIFVLVAIAIKFDIYNITVNKIIMFLFFILYISTLFIIAGIDKERINIQKSVLLFGIIIDICFMIYVCISTEQVMYTYIIILALNTIVIILNIFLKKKNYTISILMFCIYMMNVSGLKVFYYTIAIFLLWIGIEKIEIILKKKVRQRKEIKNKNDKNLQKPIGFYLSVCNIISFIVFNFLCQ